MQPKRIFFDARFIQLENHDGISRFSVGLLNALAKRLPVTAIIFDARQKQPLDSSVEFIYANDPTKLSEIWLARKLNRAGAELVYSPMNTTGSMGRKFKLILSQHDLIYFRHRKPPTNFSFPIRLGWRLFHLSYWPQRLTLNRADGLVTVSETSKRLLREHRLFRGEIAVVLNAAGSDGGVVQSTMAFAARNKIIYMGSFMPYKNVETLIRGMADLPDLELHLLSRVTPKRRVELDSLREATGGKVIWHNGVTDTEYHELLDQSLALVSASFDEGFGIPIVEAQSRGIPVVVSDIEIFHEIAGPDTQYFPAGDPKAFAAEISKLRNESTWMQARQDSLKNARRFSWQQSADELLRFIDRL